MRPLATHPVLVDGNRHGAIAAMPDGVTRGGVAGVFAPDLVVWLQDRAQHDAQRVQRARRQHDLVRVAAQAARRQQMIGDGGTQLAAAAGIAIVQMLGPERAHAPPDESAKALHRALVDMGAAERERALRWSFDHDLRFFGSVARAGIRAATKVPEPTVASAKPSAIRRS